MKYNKNKDAFIVPMKDAKMAADLLLSAIRHIRIACDLPLDKYERNPGLLSAADNAQKDVIEAANWMGFDLGGQWGNEIDVRRI